MAIHVIQSQRIEVLLQGVWKIINQPSDNPFEVLATQHFIVPSAAIEQWLTEKLSELQGITANYQFHQRIRGFQWYVYQQVLTEHRDQVRKANIPRLILKWRIYQVLHEHIQPLQNPLETEHALYPVIARVYDSADRLPEGIEKQLKKQKMLYWIAEQVSRLLNNYMLYRGHCQKNCVGECHCAGNWLAAWGQDRALDVEQLMVQGNQEISAFQLHQAQELERWQRWLWKTYFHQDFLEIQQIDTLFWQQFENETIRNEALNQLPKQVVIFTLLDLPPSQLQFLRRLGQYIDVLILHYNPSQEYWADSVDPLWKQRYDIGVKERFIQKNPSATDRDIAAFFEQFTLHFNAEARESRHPLLTRLGKQARDHFSLLSGLSTGEEGRWVDAFVDDFPETLLGKVQSDILHLAEPKAGAYLLDEKDESIRIHVCHSALRQLEVLRDQLIYWLSQGTPEQPHRPGDILVLCPKLKDMEPLIRSVFPATSGDDGVFLPVKIAGVAQLDVLNAWRAVLGRVQLLQGRFSYDEFIDWLSLPATKICYGLEDIQVGHMARLLADAGFKRGFDAGHLRHSLSEKDEDYRYSFKFALDRLAMGIAIPAHELFHGTLCYAQVQPGDFELIGKLIQIYQDIHQRRDWMVAHEQGEQLSVETWLKRLMTDIVEFEQAGVSSLKIARDVVKKQERMVTLASYYGETEAQGLRKIALPLPYILEEIQQTLENQAAQAEPTGQITFSQIGQIRPLPYRLVVLLNLDQGQFPDRDTRLPFDLMSSLRQQLGDRSRLEDDQGAFLDAVLLAQEQLWLFYNGFDVNDGEIRDPSSIVQEFRDHLAMIVKTPDTVPDDDERISLIRQLGLPLQLYSLCQVHPLQPFHPAGFEPGQPVRRYQDHWYQVALNLQQATGRREPWANVPYIQEQAELVVLDSQQWIRDISFPARLYLKTLGVENLATTGLTDQSEPLFLDGLGKYAIRHFLQEQTSQTTPDKLLDQLPVSKIRDSAWQQSLFERQCLLERLAQYASAETPTTRRNWQFSKNIHLSIQIPEQQVQDWVSLDAASARARRLVRAWLEYLLWLAFSNKNDEIQDKRRIVVFSNKTVIIEGMSPGQAHEYLGHWFEAWHYASQQPLVLPAALLLKPLEKGKQYRWEPDDQGNMQLATKDYENILKDWQDSKAYSSIDVTQDESSRFHRDWSFILQEQDAQVLLKDALARFSHALYAPIFQHVRVE